MAKNQFSLVVPTYSGIGTLEAVLESVVTQGDIKLVELIIVIDGPNKKIKTIVDNFVLKNDNLFKNIEIIQFRSNKGRFIARHEGAKLAKGSHLIFIDDRTELTKDYLKNIYELAKSRQAIISNIVEDRSNANFVGNTLSLIRSKIYKNWGKDFTAYEITEENFDKSPKGTAGLCVKKDLFIDSADEFIKTSDEVTTNSNDDTKLLKLIMKRTNLYRSAKPKLVYTPRGTAYSELIHIYKRGPMFVDYYLTKNSPYFLYIVCLYVLTILILGVALFHPMFLLFVAMMVILMALGGGLLLSNSSLVDRIKIGFGLMTVPLFFIAGIFVGTVYKLKTALTKDR